MQNPKTDEENQAEEKRVKSGMRCGSNKKKI